MSSTNIRKKLEIEKTEQVNETCCINCHEYIYCKYDNYAAPPVQKL